MKHCSVQIDREHVVPEGVAVVGAGVVVAAEAEPRDGGLEEAGLGRRALARGAAERAQRHHRRGQNNEEANVGQCRKRTRTSYMCGNVADCDSCA